MPHRTRLVEAGAGTRLDTVDSIAIEKIAAADTAGSYELFEIHAVEGTGIPPHRHDWAEAYHVLEGVLEVTVGGRTSRMHPGDTVTIPPSALHTFSVPTPRCRFLSFSLGEALGLLFAELDLEVPDGPPEQAYPVVVEVATRHGVSFVDAAPR
jgi:quercetin dioxygenase-like cupin family protein